MNGPVTRFHICAPCQPKHTVHIYTVERGQKHATSCVTSINYAREKHKLCPTASLKCHDRLCSPRRIAARETRERHSLRRHTAGMDANPWQPENTLSISYAKTKSRLHHRLNFSCSSHMLSRRTTGVRGKWTPRTVTSKQTRQTGDPSGRASEVTYSDRCWARCSLSSAGVASEASAVATGMKTAPPYPGR